MTMKKKMNIYLDIDGVLISDALESYGKPAQHVLDFLKFITSKENLEIYYATTKVPSSRKDLISLQASDPEIGVFAHANSTAKSFLRPEAEKMDSILSKMIDRVNFRGQDPDQAVSEAASQAATLTVPRN